ncbi:MAG: sensor histidine kinase, partial [Phocaeicola sp.]
MSSRIPEGTEILGGSQNDSIPEHTYLYDGLYKLGIHYSIEEIDSIAGIYLKEKNISENYIIYSINPKTGEVYKKSKQNIVIHKFGLIKSDIIPTRINFSSGLQLALNNPYKHILERMELLLISTVIMMAFIIGCIIYQIKIVSRLNKISKIREDFSYALIHDMKTPLSTILATLSFLRSGRLDDKPVMKANYYRIAENEADHLLT